MNDNITKKIRIVLVATTHPGNIGAAARAMKTMGLNNLYLVQPKVFPHVEATARAAGADDILACARVVENLDEALNGCQYIVGTSSRSRDLPITLLNPRQLAMQTMVEVQQLQHEVAIVFGRESNGLSNDELQRCHYHVYIPSNPEFSSLNVASAVQLITYEIMMARQNTNELPIDFKKSSDDMLAPHEEMQLFYQHLQQMLIDIDFLNYHKSSKLLARLRRMFNRVRPEHLELNILRGILTAVQRKIVAVSEKTSETKSTSI